MGGIQGFGGPTGDVLRALEAWHRSGANRLDADGDNYYDHSAAVALMDAWWPRFVEAQFGRGLGQTLFDEVEDRVLSLERESGGWEWSSHVQKDLRSTLGHRFPGQNGTTYCGASVTLPADKSELGRARQLCRQLLLETFADAATEVSEAQGSFDSAQWKVPATCEDQDPPICDQIVPTTAGAVDTPPFPWQNRGTFHQVDEIRGQR
jgi:hypothetical protein